MSTARTWQTGSTDSDNTLELAMRIGRNLRGGEVIELKGDLGSGKTVFVRGLARGLGSRDTVRSPSFTISNLYRAGELTLHHFDFYRLDDPGIIRRELAEILEDPKAVVAIEWAGTVEDVLPPERLAVSVVSTAETGRRFDITCPKKLAYLLEGVVKD